MAGVKKHRLDIQGIRAICMIQVLLFHAWTIGSPIGVDSFIMISAFLMAGSFIRHAERGRTPKVLHRWVNTFKRLLPPLVVVVLCTAVASVFILPLTRWSENIIQSIASLMYWENWRLMAVATDYYAGDHSLASPFQHLWSMSMQGQIFLLWPVVMAACVWIARHTGVRIRIVAALAFFLLTVIPLTWLMLGTHDGGIYFDTRARMWEFAFGSTIAVVAPYIRLPRIAANLLSWAGFLTLVTFCLVSIGEYPGPLGFAPMTAVSAMLLAGRPEDRWNASSWLSVRPLTALGNISYSVYLVHWPIFVLFLASREQEHVKNAEGVALIIVSLAAALLLHFLVDRPNQRWTWPRNPMRKFAVVAMSAYIGLTPLLINMTFQQAALDSQKLSARYGLTDSEHPGAWVLLSGNPWGTQRDLAPSDRLALRDAIAAATVSDASQPTNGAADSQTTTSEMSVGTQIFTEEPTPGPLVLSSQWAGLPESCAPEDSAVIDAIESSSCRTNGNKNPDAKRIFIIGDSHAEQLLLPMVAPLAEERNWHVTLILKGLCPYVEGHTSSECAQRNAYAKQMLERDKPDMLFLVGTAAAPDSPKETVRPGYIEAVDHAIAQGMQVIGVRDNLRSERNLYECDANSDPNRPWSGCELKRQDYFAPSMPGKELDRRPGYVAIDMTDAFCIGDVCPTIVGNTFVYLDDNHTTFDYAQTMSAFFAQRLDAGLERDKRD